jgi:hypothetical protein
MDAQYEKANAILIEMYNAEVSALKMECKDQKSDEYQTKHHEIYTRYNILWAAIRK